ncbi:oxygenase MpaB family protein [Propionibacteriaceae bacterium Y1923]|uniref:oxygenase MpaB family protein n=1 Tax=Aestuariimicrobium sp. Y1814 TaxID=3418742 RepID=UPI003C1CF3E5
MNPVHEVQRRVGMAVLSRVGGDDPLARRADTVDKPGPRWFSPSDPVWRLHDDAAMFASGVTALLLQSLHPLAMAGVTGHSGYKDDPWGRLQRTSDYIGRTTFGTTADAEAMIARVRAVHERVRGKDFRGRPYRASDPHLLAWVHIAEIWAFLAGHRAYGADHLTPADEDRYVEQCALPASLLGVIDPPTTVADLEAAIDAYRAELEASPAAVETARFLLTDPPLAWWARPAYGLLAAGGLAVLPGWAARELGLRQPRTGFARGRAGVAAVRWGLAGVSGSRRPPSSD